MLAAGAASRASTAFLDRIAECAQTRRFQEVAHFVQCDRRVEDKVGENGGNNGFRTDEDKTQHLCLAGGGFGNRQHRGNECNVERYEDVVGDNPAFLQPGLLLGGGRARSTGWSTGN